MIKQLILLCLSLLSFSAFCQTQCECEKNEKLDSIIRAAFDTEKWDSIPYYAEQIKNGKGGICDAKYLQITSRVFLLKGLYSKARADLRKWNTIISKMNCPKGLADYYVNYSDLQIAEGKKDSAFYLLLKVYTIAKENDFSLIEMKTCIAIGQLMIDIGDNVKGKKYYMEALAVARENSDYKYIAIASNFLSNEYLVESKTTGKLLYADSALNFANEALKYGKLTGLRRWIRLSYINIGESYNLKKQYVKCLAYSDSASATDENERTDNSMAGVHLQRSKAYYELKQYQKALNYADSSFNCITDEVLIPEYLNCVYLSSKKLNYYKRALEAYEKLTMYRDSAFTLKNSKIISDAEGKYNQEKNERYIEHLTQQKKLNGLITIIALLIALLIIFFFRQKSLKLNQLNLEKEQQLNRSRINPHFFFNAMTSLQFLAAKEEDKKKLVTYFFSFSKLMRQTLESTYDEYISIAKEIEFIEDYLKLQELKRENLFRHRITVEKDIDIASTQLPAMIIQPFIENAIEHGFSTLTEGGLIQIHFKIIKNELVIEIDDNGFEDTKSKDKNHISRANQITKDRLSLLNRKEKSNARFEILKKQPNGTRITIFLQLTQNYESSDN